MPRYQEDDYLQISGLQHFVFCPRQWALIHIEGLWTENYLTASGRVLHSKVHSESELERRGEIIIARGLRVFSSILGISGECDAVEFHKSADGISLRQCQGLYQPYPIEYKRGVSKASDCDRLQLCAQAICLEEMLGCRIKKGALFYGKVRRREVVEFSIELRETVKKTLEQMHNLYSRQHIPKAKASQNCIGCSLQNDCIAKLFKKGKLVQEYLKGGLL